MCNHTAAYVYLPVLRPSLFATQYPPLDNKIRNGILGWMFIPTKIKTHEVHGEDDNCNNDVQSNDLSAPLIQSINTHD